MIRFWAFVYRLTGWYSPFAEIAEYRHVKSLFADIEDKLMSAGEDSILELKDLITLEVGMWQAKHGFYRRFKL